MYFVYHMVYNVWLHPLAKVPGPLLGRASLVSGKSSQKVLGFVGAFNDLACEPQLTER